MFILRGAIVAMACLAGCDSFQNPPRPLLKTATLDLHFVSAAPVPGSIHAIDPGNKSPIYLMTPAIITTADVATIQRSDNSSDMPTLSINLTPLGTQKMAAATTMAVGSRIAIVANGTVVSAPKLNSQLARSFKVSGENLAWRDKLFRELTEKP